MERSRSKVGFIVISVIILTLLMNLVDGVLKPPYAVKSFIKVVLFFVVPLIYYMRNKSDRECLKSLLIPKRRAVLLSVGLGLLCFGVILGAYFLLKDSFDFSGITKSLTGDSGVNAENFIYVAAYISFCNSFLEEFFFRGYAFITLRRHCGRAFAYVFSALTFSLYHVGMTIGWLHIAIFLLELVGLFVGGLIFDYLNEKSETVYPSWIVHMFCNFGINTIGLILFGII